MLDIDRLEDALEAEGLLDRLSYDELRSITDRYDAIAAHTNGNGHGPKAEAFTLETAYDIHRLPEPPAEDLLIGSLLVRGHRLVIGASTGHGKTTFVGQMIKAVVVGAEFLGMNAAGGGRALIIDAEQGLRSIKKQLVKLGIENEKEIHYLRVPEGLALDQKADERQAIEAILKAGHYDVVSSDPLYKLHGGNSNEERASVDLMKIWDAWRTTYGFAHCLPLHRRKLPQGADFTMDELFGSTGYLRGAEVIVGLERVTGGRSKLHFFKDRDGDLEVGQAWVLTYDPNDGGFRKAPNQEGPDVVAELRQHFESTNNRYASPKDLARPREDGGIGRNRDKIQKFLEDNLDLFESTNSRNVEGRSGRPGMLWRLRENDD